MYIRFTACLKGMSGPMIIALLAFLIPITSHAATQTITLSQLKQSALQNHPALRTLQAQIAGAEAAQQTAAMYPNPELDVFSGPSQARRGNTSTGLNWGIGISQPIDAPALRTKRQALARANLGIVEAGLRLTRVTLLNQVEAAYIEILHRQTAVIISRDDMTVLTQVRDRVKLRVSSGEAPKFDLIKAEAELLNAEKSLQTSLLRLNQAKSRLQVLVGVDQLEEFELEGNPVAPKSLPDRDTLWEEILDQNPEMLQAEGGSISAKARLQLERQLRQPQVTVKGALEQDPDVRNWRIGVALPLPLWNQRQGPIREAAAGLDEAEALADNKRLSLRQAMDNAYSRYEIAQRQVEAYEGGLLKQAQAALKVAEAAYRFGERGILDYLDAERTHRVVRLDFLNANYELQNALLDLARLRAQELFGETK